MRTTAVWTPLAAVLLMLMLLGQTTHGQAPGERETVRFTLYKWQVKKGDESYVIEHRGETTIVRSAMGFTDRNRTVPLSVILTLGSDGVPLSFRAWGATSRWTEVDIDVHRDGGQLAIDVDGKKTTTATPSSFFVGVGYAPVAMTDQLFRYWTAHGRPTTLLVVPVGNVEIIHRGHDEVKDDDGRAVTLERYQVRGLEWGRETVWLDAAGHVAALKCVDAEFDHFEAVRNFTEALGTLVASAASEGMAALEEASRPYRVAVNEGTLALVGGTVVDGRGSAPLHDAVVLVKGHRIMAVGARSAMLIPKDASVVDVRGKTVLPGLWDMHAHFEQVEWGPIYLAAGVTSVRDCGNEMDFIVRVRDSVASGKGLGPRMMLACMADGPGKYSMGMGMPSAAAEIPAAVKNMKAAGCVQVKIYSGLRSDLVAPLARAAHGAGMTVTGHIPQGMGPMQGLDAGMDMINHVAEVAPAFFQGADPNADPGTPAWTRAILSIDLSSVASKKTIARMVRSHLVLDPTLAIAEAVSRPYQEMERDEPGLGKAPPPLRGPLSSLFDVTPEGAEQAAKRLAKLKAIVQALHTAGLPIVAGTDQAVPGHSLHRELELYVEAGFTPLEAIQAATIVPARAMKRDTELGTLEPGKLADLIVVDGDPLADIHALRRVVTVVADGRLYETAPLWRLADFTP